MIRIIGASHVLEWGVGSVLINRYDELLIGDVFPSLDFRRLGDFLKWSVGCVEGGSFPVFVGVGLSPVFLVEEVESFPVFVGAGLPNIFLGDGSWTEESFPVFHGAGLSLVFLEDGSGVGESSPVFVGAGLSLIRRELAGGFCLPPSSDMMIVLIERDIRIIRKRIMRIPLSESISLFGIGNGDIEIDGSDRHISSPLNKTDSKKCLRFQ